MQALPKLQKLNVSDCTAPFEIGVVTDALVDNADGTTDNVAPSRGRLNQYLYFL